jgi:hypothetical protein
MRRRMSRRWVLLLLAACAGGQTVESKEVLSRPATTQEAEVQHVLLGWSWLEGSYRKQGLELDPRAQKRNEGEADALSARLLARCSAGEDFGALMREHSEDPGSARSGMVYTVTSESHMAPGFVELSLRLKPGECGIVKTQFGDHVMKRLR